MYPTKEYTFSFMTLRASEYTNLSGFTPHGNAPKVGDCGYLWEATTVKPQAYRTRRAWYFSEFPQAQNVGDLTCHPVREHTFSPDNVWNYRMHGSYIIEAVGGEGATIALRQDNTIRPIITRNALDTEGFGLVDRTVPTVDGTITRARLWPNKRVYELASENLGKLGIIIVPEAILHMPKELLEHSNVGYWSYSAENPTWVIPAAALPHLFPKDCANVARRILARRYPQLLEPVMQFLRSFS